MAMTPGTTLHITNADGGTLCGASRLLPTCTLVDWQHAPPIAVAGSLVDGATVCARCAHYARNASPVDAGRHFVVVVVDADEGRRHEAQVPVRLGLPASDVHGPTLADFDERWLRCWAAVITAGATTGDTLHVERPLAYRLVTLGAATGET